MLVYQLLQSIIAFDVRVMPAFMFFCDSREVYALKREQR